MTQGHEWNPEEYKKHSGQQQKWARELIDKLNLKGFERLLDIGCGDGKVSAEIAARLPRGAVLGMDLSQDMVDFASTNFPPQKYSNLCFAQGDAADFEFERQFDVVFSNAALHWVVDHGPVLRCIARALKPGGRALLQMGGKGNAAGIMKTMEMLALKAQWHSYLDGMAEPYGFHGPEEYRSWLDQAGLTASRMGLIPKTMLFQGSEGLKGWIRTTWLPYTSLVPDELKEELISQAAEAYLKEHPPDGQDQVRVQMVRMEAELQKPA